MLAPQVGMLTALVHGGVWLEVLLNELLILLDGELDKLGISIGCQDLVEITSDTVLLVIEALIVGTTNGEDVGGHQFANGTPGKAKIIGEIHEVLINDAPYLYNLATRCYWESK